MQSVWFVRNPSSTGVQGILGAPRILCPVLQARSGGNVLTVAMNGRPLSAGSREVVAVLPVQARW